ncbi:MAG: periplasmic heavy metal sensor [Hydrogenophaga sp.]|jgi:periplasmic protein CpxP/Spy|uniref:Spy/CpxP family protein refolding chaperone n=1 Tax=Hydrogenophaga sp. TaxID=1904254 RepID=UPI0016A6CD9D|nr:Spy/CpxP family protein refolding chaperone [Hydrogenophaga sp.]NIM41198.1 periplasmic heavy metal sensor [Hydrogenophaga sp.]NIN26514.1 periplasmic heavy metal sensor [Hydrogenophaga sp.]NIN31389.1 periplasmic heavy metal sensor [Hydrogenophaga sp.]NIN55444.1 periplasmic heavy metal sensor [Hydrogenophaga sp.]NIO51779.1 periplasmic heavy metal sensor [Hydrogenophaga sp.]
MNPWIKRTLIGLTSVTVLAGGLAACGHRGQHAQGPASAEQVAEWRGKAVDRVTRKLDLTAEQRQKFEVLADKLIAQRAAMIGQSQGPRTEMKALVAGEKFDRARALNLLDEKTRVLQMSTPEVITALADFYDSLNPAQQAEVREFLEKRRGWFRRG